MRRPWYRRLGPRSMAGQMIALLLLALIAAQAVSVFLFLDERRVALRAADRAQVLSRTVSIVRLLDETPVEISERIVETASGPRLRYWLAPESSLDPGQPAHRDNPLRDHLAALLEGSGARQVLVRVEDAMSGGYGSWSWRRPWDWHHGEGVEEDDDEDERDGVRGWRQWHDDFHGRGWRGRRALSLGLSVELPDGRWLNAATLLPAPSPSWAWPTLTWLCLMAAAVALIVIFSVRRLTRPLRALAGAAERLGRGEEVPPLVEDGPADVRQATHAFNEMNERLHRFVRDRTRMLAAISHDLRTPITSLRLRAEFVEDPEAREKILETLAEMQQMVEAVLAFVREDAAREDTRPVDLAALIASLCDDLAEAGQDVTFAEADKTVTACRPIALKRALSNLIENAVIYGTRARVALRESALGYEITVDDNGPGIPEAELERVFEPFHRLETSRSRDTGGTGLGLAIARSIVRAHGGDVALENRPGGGLRATVRLPKPRSTG